MSTVPYLPDSQVSAEAWASDVEKVVAALGVDPALGLSSEEAGSRLRQFGRNQLRIAKRRHVLTILIDQFRSIVILLLIVAAILAMLFAEFLEGIAIFAVVAINGAIGFITEWRAVRSMEALGRLGRVETVVIRDGVIVQIPAEELVPGDIVIREGGDIVSADIRLIESANLQADESTLTGESMPVTKDTKTLSKTAAVMDRRNMLFKGTAVTRGSGKGVVVRTGLSTELGRISELVFEAEEQETPLEKRLDGLAQRLVWVVLALAVLIALGGVLVGRDSLLAIEVAIALAVAAIPEGLPIVATIALARGMWRMAKRNALIARLSAVETLGATSVILTDKTGTLTENRMTVTAVRFAGSDLALTGETFGKSNHALDLQAGLDETTIPLLDDLLTTAALCSNASVDVADDGETTAIGDPTEVALLEAATRRGIKRMELLETYPEITELSFDPATKLMATLHSDGANILVAVKGAPESVIPRCTSLRSANGDMPLSDKARHDWLEYAEGLGCRGLRTLAIASKTTSPTDEDSYRELTLLGIVGLEDPPRAGVRDAIDRCRSAGITVVMVTGDHAATARNIAIAVGIVEANAHAALFVPGQELKLPPGASESRKFLAARVFSRVTPEQKLELIDFYQHQNQVVAMTGDGVNDAPALKKADIGVAMGIRGTDVAKEAAAMVLQDDEFGTIVEAVAQGRAIYENIRKFVVYLLSCNISEILVVSAATIAGAPLPLLPLQILFLNLVTDVFPALALGVGEGSPRLMKDKPRPADEPVLTRSHWLRVVLHGAVISATVLGAMAIAVFRLGFDTDRAVTISFCTLALAQVWHVFNMRSDISRFIDNEIVRNGWVWLAVVICITLVLAAVYLPVLRDLLRLGDPGIRGWQLIVVMSLIPVLVAPAVRLFSLRYA